MQLMEYMRLYVVVVGIDSVYHFGSTQKMNSEF